MATMRLQKFDKLLGVEGVCVAGWNRRGRVGDDGKVRCRARCSGLGERGRRAAIRRGEMNAATKVSMRRKMSKRLVPTSSPVRGWAANLLPAKHPSLRTSGSWSGSQQPPGSERSVPVTAGRLPRPGATALPSHTATRPPLLIRRTSPPSLIRQPGLPLGGFMDTISTSVHMEQCPRPPDLNKQNHYIRQIRLPSYEHSNSRPSLPLISPSREPR
ncbi:hypothetical protein B0T18DRAFT_81551 [Schizothecium vesticola]|uniref:Uncharacterized protein n=1 Tax=Schizothecium vesticola TaxID=314040 RepID=A0AA40F6B7_9PEZI|nr:hypothetical protein B0T18DRAFT_81551 [Schizothecium vesticola]